MPRRRRRRALPKPLLLNRCWRSPARRSERRSKSSSAGRRPGARTTIQLFSGRALARMLTSSLAQMFLRYEAMTEEKVLTEDRCGAVSCVIAVAEEDKTWPVEEKGRAAASCRPGVEVRSIGACNGAGCCWHKVIRCRWPRPAVSSAGHRTSWR